MFCLQGAENGSNAVNVYQVGQLMQIFPLYNFYNFEGCPGTKLSHVKFLKLRIERTRSYQGSPILSKKALLCPKPHTIAHQSPPKKKPLITSERFGGTFLEGTRKKVSRNIALLERPECGHGAQIFICVWARSILHMVALKRVCGATSTISYAKEDWWSTCSEPVDASWHMCMITSDLVSNYVWLKTMCY